MAEPERTEKVKNFICRTLFESWALHGPKYTERFDQGLSEPTLGASFEFDPHKSQLRRHIAEGTPYQGPHDAILASLRTAANNDASTVGLCRYLYHLVLACFVVSEANSSFTRHRLVPNPSVLAAAFEVFQEDVGVFPTKQRIPYAAKRSILIERGWTDPETIP